MDNNVKRDEVTAPTLQLLAWVADGARTYADAMNAWRSSCPRLTIWEDALDAGLVQVERRVETSETVVTLTPHGREVLRSASLVVTGRRGL